MPPKVQKSKAAKLLAAQSSSKSKGKKKKWSKGKLREKKQHAVVFNKALFDKFIQEVPKKALTTIFTLVENYKINCSLARRGLRELVKRNLVAPVCPSGTMAVYTKSASAAAEQAQAKAKKEAAAAGEKKAGGAPKNIKAAAQKKTATKKQEKAEAEAEAAAASGL